MQEKPRMSWKWTALAMVNSVAIASLLIVPGSDEVSNTNEGCASITTAGTVSHDLGPILGNPGEQLDAHY